MTGRSTICLLLAAMVLLPIPARSGTDGLRRDVERLARGGSVAVGRLHGEELLLALEPDRPRVPASILKIATAGALLEALGPDHRMETRLYRTPGGDLAVEGRGDPRLVSEEWRRIVLELKEAGLARAGDLILDDTYFARGIRIPGSGRSDNPYDAICCALSSNFNTVNVRVDPRGGVASAEPQTPLVPLALELARRSGKRGKVRLNLSGSREDALRNTGELLRAFLREAGIEVTGGIRMEPVPADATLLLHHRSSYPLTELVRGMLRYSSNFTANQLLLDLAARRHGRPATMENAARVLADHLRSILGEGDWRVAEGSGLSRENRISARQMGRVLRRFHPHADLLPREAGAAAKTGTLSDMRSLAGYFPGRDGEDLWFVILLPGKNLRRDAILQRLRRAF